jgi:hypothetical protein
MVDLSTMRAAIPIPLDEIRAVCARYPIRELAIFDSVLRDDFSKTSDIDLLVEFEPNACGGPMPAICADGILSCGLGLLNATLLRSYVRAQPRRGVAEIAPSRNLGSRTSRWVFYVQMPREDPWLDRCL